jgi:hypothetical protein
MKDNILFTKSFEKVSLEKCSLPKKKYSEE